jgi:hypothetical protein
MPLRREEIPLDHNSDCRQKHFSHPMKHFSRRLPTEVKQEEASRPGSDMDRQFRSRSKTCGRDSNRIFLPIASCRENSPRQTADR